MRLMMLLLALACSACSIRLPRMPLPTVEVDEMRSGPYAGGACIDAANYERLKAKLAILRQEAGR